MNNHLQHADRREFGPPPASAINIRYILRMVMDSEGKSFFHRGEGSGGSKKGLVIYHEGHTYSLSNKKETD